MRTRRILTESDLHRFVRRAINKVLNEGYPRANGVFDDSQDGAESMQEASFYIERLKSAFAGRSMGAPSEDDVLSGEFTTPNGITIEYENQYPDYIECDAYYRELRSRGEGMSPEAREDIMDEVEHCINAQDGFFTVDFNFDSNANFVRFRVYPFNSIHEGRRMRSARPMLTELDWKTYMNAARKRKEQGKDDNADELEAYANKEFNHEHFGDRGGYGSHEDVYPGADIGVNALLRGRVRTDGGYMRDERDYTSPMYGDTINTPWGSYREKIGRNTLEGGITHHGFGKDYVSNDTGYAKKFQGRGGEHLSRVTDDYNDKIRSVGNDLNGYYNGKSRYVKGKGWE